jgi:hypothetical protein
MMHHVPAARHGTVDTVPDFAVQPVRLLLRVDQVISGADNDRHWAVMVP